MKRHRVGLFLLVLALVVTPVAAHVPSDPGDNDSPDQAVQVTDAAKSWSYYDELDGGEAQYYEVTVAADERLQVSAFTPAESQFTPSLVVMAPEFEGNEAPPGVAVPDGMGAVVVEGDRPATPGYEPFAPSANYETAAFEHDSSAQTTYLVALYEPANRTGAAGVAIGYQESFSLTEYATVPFALVETHRWEGQPLALAIGPFALTVVAGAGALLTRRRDAFGGTLAEYALVAGGLLVLASGVNTLVQTGIALSATGPTAGALVTAAYVVVPAVCGAWALRVATRASGLGAPTRVGLVVAGLAAFATWGGFLVGPALLVAVAVAPGRVGTWRPVAAVAER